MLKNLTFKVQF